MADKNEHSNARPEKKTAPRALRILLRVLTVVLSLLLVAAAVLLVLHRDEINLDALKRYLTYRALERDEDGQGAAFLIDRYQGGRYASVGENLLVCSQNTAQIYSSSGSRYLDMTVSLPHPVLASAGSYAIAYDSGGENLYLFSAQEMLWHYEPEEGNAIIAARVSDGGWLTVVEQASGYKGSVTVYNASQEPVITENISSRFVYDAQLSPDHQSLAIATIGQEDADFTVLLTIYRCTDGDELAAITLESLPLDLYWDSDGIWLQEQHGFRLLQPDGEELAAWSEPSLYLQGYALTGDGFAVEYLTRSNASAIGSLTVLDTAGQPVASLEINEEVLSLTVSGRYIALLTNSALTVYTSDLAEYAVLENDDGIGRALIRNDGTAFLVMDETARVYIP